ncbi:unnamed protein product [Caenorhabditis nigoni]
MNDTVVVVKPPSGDAFNKLMTFLVENHLDFSVKCSEPIEETPTSSQASENIDFLAAKQIRKESNREFQKIISNESEISDNLADNKLRIPKEESEVALIAHVENYDSSENIDFLTTMKMKLDNLADKIPKEEPEPESMESETSNNVPVAPIAHLKNKQSGDYDPEILISSKKPLICQVCGKGIIKTKGYDRKLHAVHHLKLKTWKCTVCDRFFSQAGVGRYHFSAAHPEIPYTKLVQTISEEDKKLLDEMQVKCFPSKAISQKRHLKDH